jgi:hypothetical protein
VLLLLYYIYYIFYLLTYSTEQRPSWESQRFSPSYEFPLILWRPKVQRRFQVPTTCPYPEHCIICYVTLWVAFRQPETGKSMVNLTYKIITRSKVKLLRVPIVYLTVCNNNHNNNNNNVLLHLSSLSTPRVSEYDICHVSSGCSGTLTRSPPGKLGFFFSPKFWPDHPEIQSTEVRATKRLLCTPLRDYCVPH